jgi:hypothetical protein
MSSRASGEAEYEGEYEDEYEGEYEGEEFFGRLAQMARRAVQNPALRNIGMQAARSALGGLRGMGPAGGMAANVLGGFIPQREYEGEFEYEGEYEGEYEDFVNPQRRLSSEALMAHLGNAAASAESEDEAEAFIGALVPLAARLIPRVAPAVMRAAPQLIRGISNVAQRLRSNPATQQLVRTLPTVARNTVASLARQVGQGRPLTPQTAVRTLAQQTARVIGSPQQATRAYQRNRALDQRYHRAAGRPMPPRPQPRYGPRPGMGARSPYGAGQMGGGFPGGGFPGGGFPGGGFPGGGGGFPGGGFPGGGFPGGQGGYGDPGGGGYGDPGGGGYGDPSGGFAGGGYGAGGDGSYAPADQGADMYF